MLAGQTSLAVITQASLLLHVARFSLMSGDSSPPLVSLDKLVSVVQASNAALISRRRSGAARVIRLDKRIQAWQACTHEMACFIIVSDVVWSDNVGR